LSLLVRFVWNGEVEERLLAMMPMNETTAEALFRLSPKSYSNME
jgi:hypothetical protein